ncbi:MAG: hypothetical protein AAGC86_13580 [Pseudomonadota bacterium]
MTPDPRWLEILKASGWQLFGLALGCLAIRAMFQWSILPPTESVWVIYGLPIATVLFLCLALASAAEQGQKWVSGILTERKNKASRTKQIEKEKQEFLAFIPFMTDADKAILGYLLQNNQKTFSPL